MEALGNLIKLRLKNRQGPTMKIIRDGEYDTNDQ